MKKYVFILTLVTINIFIIQNVFSQEKQYVILEKFKNEQGGGIFEVKKMKVKTTKYEYKEVENPEYIEISTKIKNLQKKLDKLNGKELGIDKINALKNAKKLLERAIEKSKNKSNDISIESLFSGGKKWTELKSAKKELDKTNLNFVQNTKGKFSKAINQAKLNINRIDDLLGLTNDKQEKSKQIRSKISELESKIRVKGTYIGYENENETIKKTIYKYVPIGKIERYILILDTINAYKEINGKFIAIDNGYSSSPNYHIIKKDFRRFIKNELLPRDTIEKFNIPNKIIERIGTYSPRYNDENKYLIKNIDNNKIYYTNNNILYEIALDTDDYKLYKIMKKNNIKFIDEGKKTYISKNGVKCVYTEIIGQELINNNIDIIQQTAFSVKQYNKYYKQSLKLLDIVTKHYQSYQSKTMTRSRLSKWKSDLKKLMYIKKKMDDIHYGKYKNDTSSDSAYKYYMSFNKQLTGEQIKADTIISDMIRECRFVTGI